MAADELKIIQEEADIDGPLVDYKQKGNKVELVGKEKMEGTDTYHLKATLKNGDVRNLYLDAGSFLLIKATGKLTRQGTEMEVESTLGDYRDVQGVDRKSTRLNSSHGYISYAVFCLKKKKSFTKPHTR